MINRTHIACAIAASIAVAGSASAGIADYSGQLSLIPSTEAPISFKWGDMASDETMALYIETTGHVLESPLMADVPGVAGTYHRHDRPANPFAIPAGTSIDSYFIHQEFVGSDPNKQGLMTFSVTFEQPILGLIVGGDWHNGELLGTTLNDSDFLGGPNVEYTKNADGRRRGALEGLASAEFLTVSSDGLTLSGSLHSKSIHVDNVRVITQGSVIPTPGAAALLGLAGLVGLKRRRER